MRRAHASLPQTGLARAAKYWMEWPSKKKPPGHPPPNSKASGDTISKEKLSRSKFCHWIFNFFKARKILPLECVALYYHLLAYLDRNQQFLWLFRYIYGPLPTPTCFMILYLKNAAVIQTILFFDAILLSKYFLVFWFSDFITLLFWSFFVTFVKI